MDGLETVRVIREEIGAIYAKTVPIIALIATESAGGEKERLFLQNGFNGYLAKPIDIALLDAEINRWVRSAV